MRKNYLRKWLLTVSLLLGAVCANADDLYVGGIYYRSNVSGENPVVSVINGENVYTGDIVVPGSFDYEGVTYTVKQIDLAAFHRSNVTSVVIGEGITDVGDYAFESCQSLTTVSLPSTLKNVGSNLATKCLSLSTVYCYAAEPPAHYGSLGLSRSATLYVPKGSAEAYRQDGYWNVFTSIEEMESRHDIGQLKYELDDATHSAYAAGLCSSGVETLVIPPSVEYNGETYAVRGIVGRAFQNQTSLRQVELPEGLTFIGENAFFGDVNITDVHIPASVDSIGARAFAGGRDLYLFLHSPKAPRGNAMTKDDVYSLLELAANVVAFIPSEYYEAYLEDGFAERVGMSYYRLSTVCPYDGLDEASKLIYTVDKETQEATIAHRYKSSLALNIPSTVELDGQSYSVTGIADDVFLDIHMPAAVTEKSLTSLILPSTLKRIGYRAFGWNTMLESVEFPEGLQVIGEKAFEDCFWGEDVMNGRDKVHIDIPASVREIGMQAFIVGSISVNPANQTFDSREDCNGVIRTADNTLIMAGTLMTTIPASVESIGDYVFADRSMTFPAWPESLKRIGKMAFLNNSKAQELILPEGLQQIGEGAFMGCDSISRLYIPASVEQIDRYAFTDCMLLTHITVDPANPVYDSRQDCNAIIHSATDELLWGCMESDDPAKTVLIIPQGVKRIADYAFANRPFPSISYAGANPRQSPTTLYLPSSVESIGVQAFTGLNKLKQLIIRGSATQIISGEYGQIAPLGVYQKKIYVPVGTLDVYKSGDLGDYSQSYSNEILELPSYTELGYSFNDKTMEAAVLSGDPDEDGLLEIPATASFFGEEFQVTGIGDRAFYNRYDIVSVNASNAITHVGKEAFDRTTWLQEQPEGLFYVGRVAYKYLGSCPRSVEVREGTTELAYRVFYDQRDLEEIILPESLEAIREGAMKNCGYLTSLTIPASVKVIERSAISRNTTELHSHILEPFELANQNWSASEMSKGKITCYIPRGTLELYQALGIWNRLNLVEEDVDAISAPKMDVGRAAEVFSIDGRKLSVPQRGLNIVRHSDGSARKVLMK